jgi:hypothetical protein
MEMTEFKSMWHTYNAKLEKTLKLNVHIVEQMQTQKVKSKMKVILWQRVIEIVFHSAAIVLLAAFLFANISQLPYAGSAALLIGFYVITFLNCLRQINTINRIDYSSDVVSLQKSLASLQSHKVNYARLTVLCIPTFLAYPVVISKAIKDLGITFMADFDIIALSNGSWWTAQLAASLALIPLGVWFYLQIGKKNMHKKWVRDFIQRSSGARVTKSMQFMRELESLKQGVI